MREQQPARLLVLGTRMGEFTSFWNPGYAPRTEIIHVDLDETAFGRAYPDVTTLGVRADVASFLRDLLSRDTPPWARLRGCPR